MKNKLAEALLGGGGYSYETSIYGQSQKVRRAKQLGLVSPLRERPIANAGLEVFKKLNPQQISNLQNKQRKYYKAAKVLRNQNVAATLLAAVDLNKKKRRGSLIDRSHTMDASTI